MDSATKRSKKATAISPPKGRKLGTTGTVNRTRLLAVETAYASGWANQLIERHFAAEWNVTDRTIRNYLARVLRSWDKARADAPINDRLHRREQLRLMLLDQYTKADTRHDHKGAAQIAERVARLEGLIVEKYEHTGAGGGPIAIEDPRDALLKHVLRVAGAAAAGAK